MFESYDDIPIGIDLGTTNSCIGYWNGNEVKIIPNRMGDNTTPSVVYFLNDSEEYLIGEQIQQFLSPDYQKIYSVKRLIGRDFYDKKLEEEIKILHYDIEQINNRPFIRVTQNGKKRLYSPENISSFILNKLVKDAENLLVCEIKKVVISVPAYFDDAQRNATIEAAKNIGLEVIRIINEPTAAALSYGLGQNFCPFKKDSLSFSNIFKINRELRKINAKNNSFCLLNSVNDNINLSKINNVNNSEIGKNIMVFDLGGGTYDLAILQMNQKAKEYEVKSKYSDKYLGGDDFDNKLIEYCLNYYKLDKNKDNIEANSMKRLRNACEFAKKILSQRTEAIIQVDNFIGKRDIGIKIEREQFENEICYELFQRISIPFNELIKGAGLTKEVIDEIILVGGSTRMPKIKEILKSHFSCPIKDDINPDEVVAYGATIQAAMLMTIGKNKILDGVKLYDITPISLGTDVINKSNDEKIRALGNKMSVIIPKWTRIPTSKEKYYKTTDDNQDSMQICVFEGENDYLKYNKCLGIFHLKNIPKKPKGEVTCRVNFEINANNILKVTAFETSEGVNNELQVESSKEIKNNKNPMASVSLTMSQFDKEKNNVNYDFNIKKYIENYSKAKSLDEKIIILKNYNEIILEEIKKLNGLENLDNGSIINGNNINRLFFYVYQLFESYDDILFLNNEKKENKNHQLEEELLGNIFKYLNIFKKQNIYYVKQFIDLFKENDRLIFLKLFLCCIKLLNEVGQDYIDNKQKFSRYYAKLYFEEVISLSKKYKIDDIEGLIHPELMNVIKEERNKSQTKLDEINNNAISLITRSETEKRLIVPIEHTGFTFHQQKVNIQNIFLKNDEYYVILDELEKISTSLNSLIKNTNNEMKNELMEKQSICLGNIVKIKFLFLNGNKYDEYSKIIDRCLFLARACGKNNPNIQWYEDALDLKKKIQEKMKSVDIKISEENIEKIINEINILYSQGDKREFIKYILDNYPYKGYDKNTRPSCYNWETVNKELISFLANQYHPDSYPQNTQEEKIKYMIIENISKKLNSLLDKFTHKK